MNSSAFFTCLADLRDRQAVDEQMSAFGRRHPFELLILVEQDGALARPDDTDRDVAVEQGGLRAVGIEDLHQRQPFRQHRLHLLQILVGDFVDGNSEALQPQLTISRASSSTTMFLLNFS